MKELIFKKVYYYFFDKTFDQSSHIYSNYDIDMNIVNNNHKLAKDFLDCKELLILNQVHSNNVYIDLHTKDLNKDASITKRKNVALGVLTADCVPLLISDLNGDVISAVHCGWKGALSGIIDNTMQHLNNISKVKKYVAVLGPSISQNSYVVQEDLVNKFLEKDRDNYRFFHIDNKIHFDLKGYIIHNLKKYPIDEIRNKEVDTYSNEKLYFSYRRALNHNNLPLHQRILSAIVKK